MRAAIVRGVVPKVRRSASVIPRDKALAASDLISDAHAGGGRIKWGLIDDPDSSDATNAHAISIGGPSRPSDWQR
jgi:hypothetical protein